MSIFANIISLYKSQDLNRQNLKLQNYTLINNEKYVLPKDKPILLHIWATWCPVCKAEADNIQRLSKYYDVITIAVNSGTDYEILKYMQENNLNFKVINDTEGILAKKFNVQVYPTTFIYTKQGSSVFSEVGYTSTFGLLFRMWWASLSD